MGALFSTVAAASLTSRAPGVGNIGRLALDRIHEVNGHRVVQVLTTLRRRRVDSLPAGTTAEEAVEDVAKIIETSATEALAAKALATEALTIHACLAELVVLLSLLLVMQNFISFVDFLVFFFRTGFMV